MIILMLLALLFLLLVEKNLMALAPLQLVQVFSARDFPLFHLSLFLASVLGLLLVLQVR